MRETRRSLKAANTELSAKLAVHDHATRRSLHEYIKGLMENNQRLVDELKKAQAANASLTEKLDLAKAEKQTEPA